MTCLGIGIITRNRIGLLREDICRLRQCTSPTSYRLVIADDGSDDGTAEWARAEGLLTITGPRRYAAWNKNRALHYFMAYTDCDPILLLEDDCRPKTDGWREAWEEAAHRWQHVNISYGFTGENWPQGSGTTEDPYVCNAFGGQCTVTTRQALHRVGYLDTRFAGYGWEHVEWTHRFGETYRAEWGLPPGHVPVIDTGMELVWPESSRVEKEFLRNGEIYASLRGDSAYRAAWRNNDEYRDLTAEIQQALRAG